MKAVVALFVMVLLSTSVSYALCSSGWEIIEGGKVVCQRIEEKGEGYYRIEERFKFTGDFTAKPMKKEYRFFEGSVQARAGSSSSACGLNVFANYLYGLKENIKALEMFLQDWKNSAPALLLYALATYLPVAKEALMGIEMVSNTVASLRGFTCQRAMQMIRQMNYTDSILVQNCIKNKLCENEGYCSDADYDTARATDPEKWFQYYEECLNEPNLFDVVPTKVKNWFEEKLNYRKNLYCLFWGDKSYEEVIADLPDAWSTGGIKERAKILAFALLPSFEFSVGVGDEKAKIEVGALELNPGEPADVRKLIDKMLKQELRSDVSELIDQTFLAYQTCFSSGVTSSSCSSALSTLASAIDNFEKKWNVDIDSILEEIDMLARVEAILNAQREAGDPEAGRALAELLMSIQSSYIKTVQKKVYLEVRRALEQQYDQLIAAALAQKNLGSSAGCKKSSGSGGGGSGT